MPEWAKDIYPDKLKVLAKIRYLEDFATPLMIKLNSGTFLIFLIFNRYSNEHWYRGFLRVYVYETSDHPPFKDPECCTEEGGGVEGNLTTEASGGPQRQSKSNERGDLLMIYGSILAPMEGSQDFPSFKRGSKWGLSGNILKN